MNIALGLIATPTFQFILQPKPKKRNINKSHETYRMLAQETT